uniref:NADH dehydrogenase subunit 2 n=1 Tax=Bombus pyrosoma TaxID=396416 RepID=A0A482JMP7_9HYME|nr:NADH dehydrogenase subunit 2 [Bombus pyrosoma]
MSYKILLFINMNKMYMSSFTFMLMMFFLMMNSSSIYVQWLTMEFSTILMIGMINIKSKNKIVSILYFLMSSISSLFVILIISMNFSQLMLFKSPEINMLLNISMFLKMGMFPFIFWMIYIYNMSTWNQIFLISTFMKFIPIYFFSSLIYFSGTFMILLLFNNMFIILYTNINFSIKKLFSCSSIFNSFFFIMILMINKNMFLLIMLLYLFIFFMLTNNFQFYNIDNLNFSNFSKISHHMMILMMFMYSSFPMFITFMFKWEMIYLLNTYYSNNFILILLLLSMMMMWNYFILFKYMLMKFTFNKTKTKMEIFYFKNFMFFGISIYSFMFMSFNLI